MAKRQLSPQNTRKAGTMLKKADKPHPGLQLTKGSIQRRLAKRNKK